MERELGQVLRRFRRQTAKLAVCGLSGALLLPMNAFATPFDCAHNHCGIAIDGEYPNLVVGTVDGVASPQQQEKIFTAARRQGLWHFLPPGAAAFAKQIQIISINVMPGQSLTVMESREEMNTTPVTVGELVRFSPHRGIYDTPHPGDPYWFTFGCVAVLCSAGDLDCQKGFQPGLYRVSDGAELDASGRHAVPGGTVIDTMSMHVKTPGT